jgi:hypothetical protein
VIGLIGFNYKEVADNKFIGFEVPEYKNYKILGQKEIKSLLQDYDVK